MTLQASGENLYTPMGCIKIPVEEIIENDYEVMNKLIAPEPNALKLDSFNVVDEARCKASIFEVKVFNSVIEKNGNLCVDLQVIPKKSYEAKNQKLQEALGKLINEQTKEPEEPLYACIDEKGFAEQNTQTVDISNQAVYYENVKDMITNNTEVIEAPMMFTDNVETTDNDTTLNNIDISEEAINAQKRIRVRRSGFYKIFKKCKRVPKNLESVLEFDEEEEDKDNEDSERPVSLETEVDPDELNSRLTEMQEIVDRMRNVTPPPPPPETADPSELSSVAATTLQIDSDDQIGNSTNTLRDILNARDLGRRDDNTDAIIFNLSISVAIFISFLVLAFLVYTYWLKKQ